MTTTKPTVLSLARRVDALTEKRAAKRQRERLEIADLVDVLLAPGVTVASILELVDRIYSSEPLSVSSATDPAQSALSFGEAAAQGSGQDGKRQLTPGQRAARRVEAQRRRQPIIARGG